MSMSMSICCYLYSSFFYYLVDLLPCFYLHHISHQSPNWCGRTRLQTWIFMWSKTKNKYKLVSFANHLLFLRFRQLKNLLCVCDAYASCGVSNFFFFFLQALTPYLFIRSLNLVQAVWLVSFGFLIHFNSRHYYAKLEYTSVTVSRAGGHNLFQSMIVYGIYRKVFKTATK